MTILYFICFCVLYRIIFGEGILDNDYITQEEELIN